VSERLDRIFEALPIFPLPIVLFPGEVLPLHVFEDRYKMLMRHALEHSGLFGLSYIADAAVDRGTPPDVGSVGCAAKITAVMPLEEGRMNIVSTGLIRYRVLAVPQEKPFVLARVESVTDEIEPEDEFRQLKEDISGASKRFIEAARALDELGSIPEELPEDAESLSLLISSALPIEVKLKQGLLEMTSTRLRLTRLRTHLMTALTDYDHRVRTRERSKKNGHGKLEQNILTE
jgi:Lon protease-like protein